MIKVDWNYGDLKSTPNDKAYEAIHMNDYESSVELGIDDIDNVIKELTKMKKSWEEKDFISTLPLKFKFICASDETKKPYYATNHTTDEVIVMWKNDHDDLYDAFVYSYQNVLGRINNKEWIIQK